MHSLTFDVEDWYQGFVLRGIDGWQSYGPRERKNVSRVLDMLSEYNTKATFFILGRLAEEDPKLVSLIDAEGHEVATHGNVHKPIIEHSPKSFQEDVRQSVNILEAITGKKVQGHRAARWSMTSNCSWALDVLSHEGMLYDSSVFPTNIHPYGLPSAPLQPYRIRLRSGRTIVEFPAQVLSLGPLRLPAAGGFYLRALPFAMTERALKQSEKKGHSGLVYLHPYDLDDAVPVLGAPLAFRIIRYYRLNKTEGYLRRLLQRFRFAPVSEILNAMEKKFDQTLSGKKG